MKTKFLLISMLLFNMAAGLFAQNEFDVSRITVINLGDGRMLFRELISEKTLSGEHRIIDGRKTEYVLAKFTDGLYNGSYELYKYNALSEKGSYKEGRKDGDWFEYFSDGSVKTEYHCTSGKLNGARKTYFTNGKTETEIEYKNGIQHGKELRYDYETGNRIVDAYFVEGKPEGKQTRYISSNTGDYVQVSNYKNGLRNGESATYYTDGTVEKIINYTNDKKEGITKEWDYNSGKLKSEYTFSDDKKGGPYKIYNVDNGQLHEEGRCEDGSEVYTKSYYSNGKLKEIRERNARGWVTLESYDENGVKNK